MPNLEKKSQPSESEVREFWERCGWEWTEEPCYGSLRKFWVNPEGLKYQPLPSINPNSIFKWAVPKAVAFLATQPIGCPSIIAIYEWLFDRWLEELEKESDFALALYRVLDKVMEVGK